VNRMFALCAAALTLSGSASSDAALQAQDFSGRWTIDAAAATPAPSPGAPAPAGRPDQARVAAGDMGSGWGSPLTITQDARQLLVEQTLFSRYDMSPPLRFVYALDGSESRNAVNIGHTTQVRASRTAWAGLSLLITTHYPGVDPGSGKTFTTAVTHRLTLESPVTLVVEVTRGAALGGKETTTRTVYRKG
jgi:hypothetical protein